MSIYFTGLILVAAVSWFVATPFLRTARPEGRLVAEPEKNRWQKRKEEALAAIKEAEFDFHLGKLSESDYHEMRRRLEVQALQAIEALEGRVDGNA